MPRHIKKAALAGQAEEADARTRKFYLRGDIGRASGITLLEDTYPLKREEAEYK